MSWACPEWYWEEYIAPLQAIMAQPDVDDDLADDEPEFEGSLYSDAEEWGYR